MTHVDTKEVEMFPSAGMNCRQHGGNMLSQIESSSSVFEGTCALSKKVDLHTFLGAHVLNQTYFARCGTTRVEDNGFPYDCVHVHLSDCYQNISLTP